jgi:hypothetical protein
MILDLGFRILDLRVYYNSAFLDEPQRGSMLIATGFNLWISKRVL